MANPGGGVGHAWFVVAKLGDASAKGLSWNASLLKHADEKVTVVEAAGGGSPSSAKIALELPQIVLLGQILQECKPSALRRPIVGRVFTPIYGANCGQGEPTELAIKSSLLRRITRGARDGI